MSRTMNYKNVDVEITKKGKRKSKQADGKVSCTFHLPFDVRDDLQALAFMTKIAQTDIVESAIRNAIKDYPGDLPQRS